MKEKLTSAERKRLINYRQTLRDTDGDYSVFTPNEWHDLQYLRTKIGEVCPKHGIDLQNYKESLLEEHHCEEK